MDPRRQRAAWAAVTVVGALIPFAPAVVGLRTLRQRDTDLLYAPLRTLVVEALRDGRLPLWNPFEGAGKPLFAEGIHSVLHPVSLLGAALAPSSLDFLILAYLLAAALGAFLLAWTLGTSPPACAGAGLAFALSGYSVSMTGNLVFLAGLSTLPWLVAAARAAGAAWRWAPVATALATACAFFSGDVQVAVVGLALGALLALEAGGLRGVARALGAMIPGVLLAGIQIAATRELLPRTYRSLEVSPWDKVRWPLAPWRLLEWVTPGLSRGPLSVFPAGASAEWIGLGFAESVFLGAPLLVAAVLGATARSPSVRRRTGIVLGGSVLVLLWLALGHRLGARQLLDWVPIWSRFRYSEKLMAPLGLALCGLGALGIDAFDARRLSAASRRVLYGGALVAGGALLALLVAPAATSDAAAHLLGDAGVFYRATLAAGLPHVLLALAAILVVDRLGPEGTRGTAMALLVALAPGAAVRYGAHFGAPEARVDPTEIPLASDGPAPRIAHPVERPYTPSDRYDDVDEGTRKATILLEPSLNVARRVDAMGTYGAFEPRRFTTLHTSLGAGAARSFRRFGATHVVVPLPRGGRDPQAVSLAIEGARPVQRDPELGREIWAVPHRPWAFFPRQALARERPQEAHELLLGLIDRGEDDVVVVEAESPPPTAAGRVLGVERGVQSIRIEAESDGPALLVVQDAHWPGWRAAVDGRPVEILVADLLVRAVRWPAGRHVLDMVYDPPGVRFGWALSALGAAFVVVLIVLEARREGPARG